MTATVKKLGAPLTNPSAQAISQYDSQAFTNSDVVSATPCSILSAMAFNKSQTTLYLMLFDSSTVPSNGTVPLLQPLQLGSLAQVSISEEDIGRAVAAGTSSTGLALANGLSWASSTSAGFLAVDSSNSVWLTVDFS